jgi:hypothetical protein
MVFCRYFSRLWLFAYLAMKNRIKALTEYRRTFRHSQAIARGDSLYALSVDFLVAV